MVLELANIQARESNYFHREYKNDFAKTETRNKSVFNQGIRVVKVALPFVALYKPFGQSLALVMGGCRFFSCFSQTIRDFSKSKTQKEIASDLLQTTIVVASFAGGVFAHPMGMVISTVHDLVIESSQLITHMQKRDQQKTIESCLSIINNTIYLSLLIHGGVELRIASLAVQIILGVYQSQAEFKEGNYLEGTGYLLMATIRTNQMIEQMKILQMKWMIEKAFGQCKSAPVNFQNQLYQSILKDSAEGIIEAVKNGASINLAEGAKTPLLMAILMKKSNAVEELVKLGANVHIMYEGHPLSHHALKLCDVRSAFVLVKAGCSFAGSVDDINRDVMHYAANFVENCSPYPRQDALNLVQELINKGYNVHDSHFMRNILSTLITHPGRTEDALDIAIKNGANVNQLIVWPENLNETWTPLLRAIYFNNILAAKILLDAGANINQSANPHRAGIKTPISYALAYRSAEMVAFLLENGASL